jgi:flagellar motor switch protein FliN
MSESGPPTGKWFAEEWTAALCRVLDSLTSESPRLECVIPADGVTLSAATRELAEQHGDFLWWQQNWALPGAPAVWIGAPRNAWSGLAGRVLPSAEDAGDSQAREKYLDILRQSFGELDQSAARRWNRAAIDSVGTEQSDPPVSAEYYRLQAADGNTVLPSMLVAITGAPQEPGWKAEPQSQPSSESFDGHSYSRQFKTFDLLMGVELPVSVSFGRIQLPLKDVLKLTAGSIIELNRTVDEPVEVIVNNCVVARGEVVMVEGNYGVRIRQIMSRQQRLESLP